jgi:hypothetical protein
MDFYKFRTKENKNGTTELYPGFIVGRSTDLMVRGGQFYAVWDEKAGLWSTDEYAVARLVDEELFAHAKEPQHTGRMMVIRDMTSFESTSWSNFKKFINQIQDNSVQLDQDLTFANTDVKKADYVSKRLPYSLQPGDHSAWDELVGTLYSVEERAKIEWMIGAIVSGDSKKIQKFGVFYGPPGSGKGTVLDIVHKLFQGYTTTFEAKSLGSANAQFALEVFKNYPLVGIQGDGDLSRIQDNARLNSIVSHEPMTINEKFKSAVTDVVHTFLMMGTNSPVQITDAKSGMIRRLIDIHPTGVKIPINHYLTLIARTDFELGAIAQHCLEVYQSMGRNFYESYRPLEMMLQTDAFFNFIEYYFDVFKEQDGVTLTQAYTMYKEYCADSGDEKPQTRQKFQYELRNYFEEFKDRAEVGGHQVRNYYSGFSANKFKAPAKDDNVFSLVIEDTESLLDDILADQPAQGWREDEFGALVPKHKWANVKTTLKDLDTHELHYVKLPPQHIVIDFDLKDDTGEKSLERNLQAASNWPATYAELSKGGNGVHLHYEYEGDVTELSSLYSEGIEIKTLLGDASLRRRLTKCNAVPIAPMNGGLPLKEKKMLDERTIQSEKGLRAMLARNLAKEFHGNTVSSVSFIKKILDDAFANGVQYDVTDLRGQIMAFAAMSTNHKLQCLKMVQEMKWASDKAAIEEPEPQNMSPKEKVEADQAKFAGTGFVKDDRLVFFDVEVFPNLFVVCWKFQGSDTVVRMVNPSAQDIAQLLTLKLVGFYNRRYDNHIVYAASLGYPVEELFKRSQKIVEHNDHTQMFGEAYSLSYADIWDFSSLKQSLKIFEIQLGIKHVELNIPWDKPVPPELVDQVVEYCVNDVNATEAVFESRKQDFVARQILASLSGLTVNDTTQKHTARILFGNDRNPAASFNYTHLHEEFPGYTFDPTRKPMSDYKGEDPSEGGYVKAKPGMYQNVRVFDVASMHPTSIVMLNLFGDEYTPKFKDLLDARVAIKRKQYDKAKTMLGGKLAPYLEDPKDAKQLSYALKIVINIVYGLTSAKFDNPFRDIRNRDNIVAKRGALFMIDLEKACEARGMNVVHIKTDSIKIADATDEDWAFVNEFGTKYGYEFEHEATYDKFCLVNNAVYIARYGWHADDETEEDPSKHKAGTWDATGAQFQHPYVFKTLFSGEEIENKDLAEAKQVTAHMYLDFEHDTPDPSIERMKFVGKAGRFVPVAEGQGGGVLYRAKDGKLGKVTGTTGHLWMEADIAFQTDAIIDMTYFDKLTMAATRAIGEYGDLTDFLGIESKDAA